MTPYSQRDPKWKNIKLGFSDTTIGDYGCTITAIGIILDLPPDVVNERMKAVNGFAADSSTPTQKNLVIWDAIARAFPGAQVHRVWNYNNDDVKANTPNVIVEVDGVPIGGYRHWITYIGNQESIDPWDGKKKATSSYPNPLSYCVIKPPVVKPTDPTITIGTAERDKLVGRSVVAKEVGEYLTLPNPDTAPTQDYKNVIGGIKSDATTAKKTLEEVNKKLDIAEQEVTNRTEQVANVRAECQVKLDLKNAEIKALNAAAPNIEKLKGEYQGTIDLLQSQLRDEQRAHGITKKELAALKSTTPSNQKSLFEVLQSIIDKVLPFLKKTNV